MLGPQAMFPEHAPRDEAAKVEKRKKVEDESLEEQVADIVRVIDQNRMLGPQAMFPEHAPRDEAAKVEERKGIIEFHCVANSLTEKVPKQTMLCADCSSKRLL